MANSPTIVAASLSDDQLKKSIDSLVTHVDEAMKKMVQSTNNAVGEMEAKLKSLGNVRINSGGTADGGSSRRTSAVEKETKARKELNMTLDQQAAALEKASGKKKGIEYTMIPSDIDKSLTYLVNTNKDVDAQMSAIIQKEQALIDAKQREAQITEQIASAQRAANSVRGVSAYDLGIDPNVSAGRQRQIASTRAASKETEYLKQQVASLLEVEEREIKTANTASSSYAQLAQYLKNLQSAYQRLGADRIAKGEGTDLAKEIQSTQRAMQKLQQTMSRPISLKDAMGLSEKTLDDIAYKMRQLSAYRSGLDISKQSKEITQVNDEYNRLKKRMDEVMQKNQQMIASNTALGRSWNYMKNRLAFYFTVGASTQFVKNLIEVRSQYEMNERALGILIDSAERGTQIFNELSQMALVSPYTLIELSTAAKQLTAYDVAAKDVVDTTRRLADMASAVGIPIERLTYALGQIKAYGYLNSRDARMFANAGIPLVKQLADYYTELEGKLVSTADIYDRIKKKTIGYNDVMSVMYKMTDEGGKFFDFQAKMADTLKVRLANLTLAWNNMLNDMGKESQGVLTWGIGALRELFLQWRTFDKTLKEAAGAFGLYKAIQLIILGLQTATKSTLGLNARLTATGVLGTRLVTIFKALGSAMKSLAANWWLVLVAAAVELSSAIINANEATKEFNKSMREGAESTANDLKKYIEQYKDLRDSLYKTQTQTLPNGKTKSTLVPQDIDKNEASKAWETMREQIELSSAASTDFVSRLLQIENVSDRLREGFKIIDDITQVNAALKDMGDEALVVTQKWSAWWNAWQAPDGLFTNLKEFKVELDEIRQKYGDIANARYVAEHGDTNRAANEQDAIMRAASEAVNDYDREMNRFRVDLDKYTSSLDNFANAMEFSSNPTQVAELYAKAVKQLATQGQLSPQEAFDLQLQIEEARTNAMKLALQSRISDEESALKVAQNERVKESLNASIESNKAQLKLFENSTYEQTAYWNDFTKYIKERHISELTAAYNAMTENGKKEMDFQSVEWQKYVHKWANSYEKSHNLATDSVFNRIKNWINDANTWSIFIKMTISTEDKKSVYKELGEWDKAADDAYKTMQRLDKEISRLRKKGAKEVGVMLENNASADDKKLTQAIEERTQAQKDYNEAVANGGESKKKDAAGSKAQKAAESELAKALKDELSTIDKVRSIYKDLTKEGMSHANAVERATKGWDETVDAINRVLQKNGLQKLDLSKFAGIENPRELVNMLQSQLNTLLKRGAKPAEIKELQTKVNSLEVDADKYDLTKITKGLNNELGKLKDEYELAVELDANPELGDMFADMFGINSSTLPKTFGDAIDRAQTIINRKLAEMNITTPFDLMEGNIDSFAKSAGLDKDSALIKELVSAQNAYRDMFKKNITETEKVLDDYIKKYGDYSDKIAEIEASRLEKLKKLNEAYYTEEMRKRPEYVAKLNAIEQGAKKEEQQVDFEEFKNSRYYTMMFENLDYISTKTIRDMRDRVREYIDTAKDLTPEQLKTLISQYEKLEQKVVRRSPFKTLAKDLKEYFSTSKERKAANNEFRNAEKEYNAQSKIVAALNKKYEQAKANSNTSKSYLEFLQIEINAESDILDIFKKQLELAQKKADKYNLTAKLAKSEALSVAQVVGQNLQSLGELRDFLQQDLGVELSDELNGLVDGLSKVGQGINKITSSATSGDIVGVITGVGQTVYGLYDGIASIFGGGSAGDKKIVRQIEDSELAVKRLELAYKNLEVAIESAYGANVIGAKQAAIANKELQLAELNRQLALEKSRDSKKRDDDRIMELQGQIIDLQNDIKRSAQEIATELLGISSVADAAQGFMDSYIDALRRGEDAMEGFNESVNDMIANLISKIWVTRVIAPQLERIIDEWNNSLTERSKKEADAYRSAVDKETRLSTMNGKEILSEITGIPIELITWEMVEQNKDLIEKYVSSAHADVDKAKKELDKATTPTKDDVGTLVDALRAISPELADQTQELLDWLTEFKLMKGDASNNLSALQQGIQGVTEDTAGALEAYMNGVSQQVYLQSDLLTQIRDAVVGIDIDVQVATQAQMLLQLQQSYAVQMAIQGILEGWATPSGQAVRVELVS